MGRDQRADEVVAGTGGALGDQLVGVSVEALERGLDSVELGGDVDREPEPEVRGPGGDRAPLALGEPQDDRDHPAGVGLGELGHELAAAGGREAGDQLLGQSTKARDEAIDRARREGRVEQPPNPGVVLTLEVEQRRRPPLDERAAVDAVVGRPRGAALTQALVLEQLLDLLGPQHRKPIVRAGVPALRASAMDLLGLDREARLGEIEVGLGHRPNLATSLGSVRARQPERVLGDVVEDHLARDRGGAEQADAPVEVGEPVLEREAVAAVGLDRLVDAADRRPPRPRTWPCSPARPRARRRRRAPPPSASSAAPARARSSPAPAGARCPGGRRSAATTPERSRAYPAASSSARRAAPLQSAAPMIRSGLSPSKAAFSPTVSDSPISRSAGTSTSSK